MRSHVHHDPGGLHQHPRWATGRPLPAELLPPSAPYGSRLTADLPGQEPQPPWATVSSDRE